MLLHDQQKMKRSTQDKLELLISLGGLAVLIGAFLVWCSSKVVSIPGFCSALLSAVLFAIVCLRFVPEWMFFWRRRSVLRITKVEQVPTHKMAYKNIELKIFFSLILVNLSVIVAAFLLRRIIGYQETFVDSLEFWTCTDSYHYLAIARDWYLSEGDVDRLVQLVFLPGYPIVVRLVNCILYNYLYSGLLVSLLSFAGAGCVIYRLLLLDFDHQTAIRTIKYFCLLPGAFFFTAPMSESLFLLLCASCLYFARTKRWLLGCLFGALAAFTRSLGLTLFVPLFFELVAEFKNTPKEKIPIRHFIEKFLESLLVFLGFGAYCLINYFVAGNPFKFLEYQKMHWNQQLGWFFNTACYQLEEAINSYSSNSTNLLGLWLPNLIAIFSGLIIMIFAVRLMRPSYTAWYISYFLIAIGATWLLSAPRYLITLIPVPLAVSLVSKKATINIPISIISGILYTLYFYAFVMRWQVW